MLLTAPDAVRWRYARTPRQKGAGENPPRGALIYYVLDARPKGELKIEILDAAGRTVRTLSSVPQADEDDEEEGEEEASARKKKALATEPGLQRAVWDLGLAGRDEDSPARRSIRAIRIVVRWRCPARTPCGCLPMGGRPRRR